MSTRARQSDTREHFSRSADAVINVYDEAAFKSIVDQAKSAPEKKAKKAA
jgi:hypothetical protein